MLKFFSIFKFGREENYEAILADLDAKIQAQEVYLADLKVQRRSLTNNAFIYLFGAYLAYIPTYLLVLRDRTDPWGRFLFKSAPLILMPVLLYFIRIFIQYLYTRRITSNAEILKALQTKQKLKVEELKNNSSYYQTKNLIDRYSGGEGNQSLAPPSQPMKTSLSGPVPHRPNNLKYPSKSDNSTKQSFKHNRGANKNNQLNPPSSAPLTKNRPWYDKLVDALVGDEPNTAGVPQFALICQHCFAHNGLVSAIEYETIQYSCPKCKQFNPSRRSLRRRSIGNSSQLDPQPSGTDMARSSTAVPSTLSGAPGIRPLPQTQTIPSSSAPILPPLQLNEPSPVEANTLPDPSPSTPEEILPEEAIN